MNFSKTLKLYQRLIDKALRDYLSQKIKELPSFGNSFVKNQHQLFLTYCLRSGKRLRPILTLMAYRAVGGRDIKKILTPALAFELYHNYTLIHDDIYDEDEQRRGEWASHILLQRWFEKKYGRSLSENILYKNSAARFGVVAGIINGKYLHTLSSLPILESKISDEKKVAGMKLHQAVSIFDNTGQAIDLYFEQASDAREQDYYDMVLCKTGRLFQAVIEWGAILGGAGASQRKTLGKYAEEISIAFQLKDDLLDIDFKGGKGRGIGSDIKKGKKTLLAIQALKKANIQEKKFILRILGNGKATTGEIKKVIAILHKSGSVDYCRRIADLRVKKAIHYLRQARPPLAQDVICFFQDLAYFMAERKK